MADASSTHAPSSAEEQRLASTTTLLQVLQTVVFRHLTGTWVYAFALHLLVTFKRIVMLVLVFTSFLDLGICVLTVKAQGKWTFTEIGVGICGALKDSAWESWERWKLARQLRHLLLTGDLRLTFAVLYLQEQHTLLESLPSHLSPRRGPFYHPGFCLTPRERALRNFIDSYIDARLACHGAVDAEGVQIALWDLAQCSVELSFTQEGSREETRKEEVGREFQALQYLNYRIFLAQEARLALSSLEPSRGRQFAPPYYSRELLAAETKEGREFGRAVGKTCWELRWLIGAFGRKARSEWVTRRLLRAQCPERRQSRRQPTSLELSLLRLNALITHTHLLHPTPRPSNRDPPTCISLPFTSKSWTITQDVPPDEPRCREQILDKLAEEKGDKDWLCVWEEWRRCVVEVGMARKERRELGLNARKKAL